MSTLLLARHGRTSANDLRRLVGVSEDNRLTEFGAAQVELLADHLEGTIISKVISSSFRRARQTASILHQRFSEATFIVDDDLRERNYGVFEGLEREELIDRRSALGLANQDPTVYFPAGEHGVEDFEQVGQRVSHVIERHQSTSNNHETTLLVTHAGAITAYLYRALRIPQSTMRAFKIREASCIRVEVDVNGICELHEIWANPKR